MGERQTRRKRIANQQQQQQQQQQQRVCAGVREREGREKENMKSSKAKIVDFSFRCVVAEAGENPNGGKGKRREEV